MKIAFWSSGFLRGYGGAELCAAELINTLAERGDTCYLLTSVPEPGGSAVRFVQLDERVTVRKGVFHNPMNFRNNPFVFLFKILRYFCSAVTLLVWLARERVDVVHQHFVGIDVVMLVFFKRLLGYRLVLTYHGLELELASENTLSNWKNRLALKGADHVTAVARQQCELLRQINPDCRIHHIPNALNLEQIRRLARQPSDLPIQPGQFVYCGRLNPVKQVAKMVEVFEQAIRQGCSRNLYIMGSGVDYERVVFLIDQLGISDRVFTLPGQERRHALRMIKQCRGLLLNSSSEGYPMVILEAMVLGKPVIAPEVGGIGEMVIHGESALLFPAGDKKALCAAIIQLDRDEELATVLGENANQATANLPDLYTIVNRYVDIYCC